MNIYLTGLLCVLGAAAIAVVLNLVNHRRSSDEDREKNNDAAGKVFSLVGGLHAVLVAFVLISLLDATSAARAGTYREANSLVGVAWAGDALPEPARTRIRELTRSYAETVINEEWPRMEHGEPVGRRGGEVLDELRATINSSATNGGWEEDRKINAAKQIQESYQARQERLAAMNKGVSPVVWFALIIGGLISILFPFMFGGPKRVPHTLIVVTFTVTTVLLLFAIYRLDNPFSSMQVNPEAFRAVLDQFGRTA